MLHELVIVQWLDIVVYGGWEEPDKTTETPSKCTTIGWLHVDNAEYITVSSTLSRNGSDHYNTHTTIPVGCIINIERLPVIDGEKKDV